jgi:hypothetical protein
MEGESIAADLMLQEQQKEIDNLELLKGIRVEDFDEELVVSSFGVATAQSLPCTRLPPKLSSDGDMPPKERTSVVPTPTPPAMVTPSSSPTMNRKSKVTVVDFNSFKKVCSLQNLKATSSKTHLMSAVMAHHVKIKQANTPRNVRLAQVDGAQSSFFAQRKRPYHHDPEWVLSNKNNNKKKDSINTNLGLPHGMATARVDDNAGTFIDNDVDTTISQRNHVPHESLPGLGSGHPSLTTSSTMRMMTIPNEVASTSSTGNNSNTVHQPEPRIRRPVPPEGEKVWIEKASESDIICGRGGSANKHNRNHSYLPIILEEQRRYKVLPKKVKSDYRDQVIERIKASGARFVKWDNIKNKYFIQTDQAVKEKVSQALREDHTPEGRAGKMSRQTKNKKDAPKSSSSSVQKHDGNKMGPIKNHDSVKVGPIKNHNSVKVGPIKNHDSVTVSPIKDHTSVKMGPMKKHTYMKKRPGTKHSTLKKSPTSECHSMIMTKTTMVPIKDCSSSSSSYDIVDLHPRSVPTQTALLFEERNDDDVDDDTTTKVDTPMNDPSMWLDTFDNIEMMLGDLDAEEWMDEWMDASFF